MGWCIYWNVEKFSVEFDEKSWKEVIELQQDKNLGKKVIARKVN